jgi:hypothetical protein
MSELGQYFDAYRAAYYDARSVLQEHLKAFFDLVITAYVSEWDARPQGWIQWSATGQRSGNWVQRILSASFTTLQEALDAHIEAVKAAPDLLAEGLSAATTTKEKV